MPSRHEAASPRLTADEVKALAAKLAPALADAITDEADAFSLARFCRRHGITLQMFYKLATKGLRRQTFNVGTRVLVCQGSRSRVAARA